MRNSLPLGLLVVALSLVSCAKEAQDVAQDLGLLPSGCGSDGARFQATIGETSYCAGAQILATGNATSALVTGVDLAGNTLVLQLDSLAMGEQVMTEASNNLLYMQTGVTFTIAPEVQGTLNITHLDTQARTLKATFQVPVFNVLNGATEQVEGEVDVTYSTGG